MVMQIMPIALLLLNTSQISFYFLQRIINVIDTSWEIPASSSWISVYFVDPFSSKNKIFSLKLYVKKKSIKKSAFTGHSSSGCLHYLYGINILKCRGKSKVSVLTSQDAIKVRDPFLGLCRS